MGTVEDIAIIVGLVRDILLLSLLTIALIALLIIAAKIRQLLNTVQETANTVKETVDSVQDTVNTVSEKVVEPASSNAGAMRRLGGFFGFILGMVRRRKREE